MNGIIAPIVTLFTEAGTINAAAVEPFVKYLVDRGVSGLFPGGATGEGFLLGLDERRLLTEAVVEMKDSGGSLETLTQVVAATNGKFNAITIQRTFRARWTSCRARLFPIRLFPEIKRVCSK